MGPSQTRCGQDLSIDGSFFVVAFFVFRFLLVLGITFLRAYPMHTVYGMWGPPRAPLRDESSRISLSG